MSYGNGLNSFKVKKKITKVYVGNQEQLLDYYLDFCQPAQSKFYLYGDRSMNKRDMSRVIEPLEKIGCVFLPKK